MNPERLLQHFDQIAEAPDAVPRLRRFILDLAVRGKLVEQNPEDEPASVLLKKIDNEKARLEKDGVIRTLKPMSPLDRSECLYSLPSSWKWIRLGNVGSVIGGGTPPSKDDSCFTEGGIGVAWLTPADLGKHNNLFVSHGARDLTEKGLADSSAQLMPAGTVLFTSRAPIGYTAIAANKISTNQGFKSVVPFVLESNRYIAIYFKAFASWIDGKASGTTFKEVSGKIVTNLPFPLPPLAEQNLIVAKVDQLMALCDEMEAVQAKREKRRDRLVVATLHGLNNSVESEEPGIRPIFEESARFYFNHLPRLTTRSEHIHQLRQTILNLAVRGKLVPQDPNDEIASELLEHVKTEEERQLIESRTKTNGSLIPIEKNEARYEIPDSWQWVRLRNLLELLKNGFSGTTDKTMGRYKVTRIETISYEAIDLGRVGYIDDLHEDIIRKHSIKLGDILFSHINSEPHLGKTAICTQEDPFLIHGINLLLLRVAGTTNPHFLNVAIRQLRTSGYFVAIAQRAVNQSSINQKNLGHTLIPLPPLAEQHRIVAKVDELTALCNELEAQLNSIDVIRRKFLETTLYESLGT